MRHVPAPATPKVNTPAVDRMQSRVDAAAFALIREGRNPTVSLVRARMGGASPNLVAPALQRWRQTFAAQLDDNAGSALEVLPPGVLELVQALWSRALFEAHRVRDDSPSGAEALNRLNATITELRNQMDRLQARESLLDAQLRELDRRRRRQRPALRQVAPKRPRNQRPALRKKRKVPAKRSISRPVRRRGTASKRH
jgi:Plasmid replication region DNA-binding N-term